MSEQPTTITVQRPYRKAFRQPLRRVLLTPTTTTPIDPEDDHLHHRRWQTYSPNIPTAAAFDFYDNETFWALNWCRLLEYLTVAGLLAETLLQLRGHLPAACDYYLRASDWW